MFGANLETVSGQIVRICWLFRCFWRRTHPMLLPAFYASIWPLQWAGQELSVKVVQMPLMPLFNICSDIFPNVSAQLFSIWPHFGGLQTPVYLRVCFELCLGKERESVRHYWQGEWGQCGGREKADYSWSRLQLTLDRASPPTWQSGLLHPWRARSLPPPGARNAPNLPTGTPGEPGEPSAGGCTWLHTPQRKRVRSGAKNHTALSHAVVKSLQHIAQCQVSRNRLTILQVNFSAGHKYGNGWSW